MLNNKGQSLILFIMVLPILLLILIISIDVGRIIVRRQELDNINKIALNYGLDKQNDPEIQKIIIDTIKLNDNTIDKIEVLIDDDKIYIKLNDTLNGLLSKIINISKFEIESSYYGYIDNNKKRIERVEGD